MFHERAKIVGNLDKKSIGDIESYTQIINFNNFLYHFDENDDSKIEIQDVLDTEYEKLEDLKEKCEKLIENTNFIIQLKKKTIKNPEEEHLLLFFTKKLEELVENEKNMEIFMHNLDKVESLSYNSNGTKLNFFNI